MTTTPISEPRISSVPWGQGLSALVVDDEIAIRLLVTDLLEEEGFRVTEADSFRAAIQATDMRNYDLVITDKNLGDGNGLDLLRVLEAAGVDTAMIMMTAHADVESAVSAMQLGVSDYVKKPFDLGDMVRRTRRVLQFQAIRRRNRELLDELRRKNAILEELAVRDSLTRLYDHGHFQDCLTQELLQCRKTGGECGLLFIDIDKFKDVNDVEGHQTGDRILKLFAVILQGQFRASDRAFRVNDNHIAARYGGDEFALILPDTPKAGTAFTAERLRRQVESFDFTTERLPRITVSIGAAAFPVDAESRSRLIECADLALYAAKRAGRNRVISYHTGLDATLEAGSALATQELARFEAFDTIVSEGAFRYFYQPIVDITNNKLMAYEALVRPQHPSLSSPSELIAVAERCGRLHELGRLLRKRAASVLDELPEDVLLFVNLHPYDLQDTQLLGIEPFFWGSTERIVLEITELTAIRDWSGTEESVNALRNAGFGIAIDDFGEGYSGISRLGRLEADYAKLSLHLVRDVDGNERSERLLRHLLEFCEASGVQVIAEGVETPEELEKLKELGCRYAQGFLLGRPAPFPGKS